jgi:hypothetical protein
MIDGGNVVRQLGFMVAVLACFAGLACTESKPGPQANGQTHWLSRCTSDDDCGGLECVCGVCTRTCTETTDCSQNTDKLRVPVGSELSCRQQAAASVVHLCGDVPVAPLCLQMCSAQTPCPDGQRCLAGDCVPNPEPLDASSTELDADLDGSLDGGAASLDASEAAPCAPCIGEAIGWGPNGGFVAYTEHSTLSDCNVYGHTRTFAEADAAAPRTCERPLPCMGSGLHGISDVLLALEHADVVAARALGSVLYGTDSRPVDGTVLRIELPSSTIEVGEDCNGAAGCTPIPTGIVTLAGLLQSIDQEQLALEPCLSALE